MHQSSSFSCWHHAYISSSPLPLYCESIPFSIPVLLLCLALLTPSRGSIDCRRHEERQTESKRGKKRWKITLKKCNLYRSNITLYIYLRNVLCFQRISHLFPLYKHTQTTQFSLVIVTIYMEMLKDFVYMHMDVEENH